VSRQVQQGINFGHRDPFWTISELDDVVACANFSLLQHAKVKSWPSVCDEQPGHPRVIQADAHAVAGHARLCDFEYGVANAISITNADLVIGKPFNSEILSKLAETKIIALEDALPVPVRILLVDKYGTLLSTVTSEIGLRIAIDIQLAHHPSSLHRKLPDRRSHSLAVPSDVAWKTDI